MKTPKTIRKYCKHCNKPTEQAISAAKKRDRGTLKRGSIARGKGRGRGTGLGNKGRWGSKPTKPKMLGKKTSKKRDLRYKCKECGKTSIQRSGVRTKKLVFE
ncbi:MAG: 50S ribosomal protein L44e [Candidatus Nanoarchaeia archaeon]|nr:50S ribosomal protein L44e [Candidatus Nanoarchaeia archaeon]